MIRILPLLLLTACANPIAEMELLSESVDLGSGATLLEGEIQVRSISQDPLWVYAKTTNAQAETDPEQDLASFDYHPVEIDQDGAEVAPGADGVLPVTYDCSQTEILGPWAVGLRVLVGPDPGGAEMAVWDLGVIDLTGDCTEAR